MHYKNRIILIILFLVLSNLVLFLQIKDHNFINYDDNDYVTENIHVRAGWTMESLKWAFTTSFHKKWHPFTWLSHMTDCWLFGLESGRHHLVSLLFHIVNTLLLFLILHRMTGALLRSAFVAALFALHPLHVEPVAWIAGRKDVLSTFFWMLTMGAYALYVEHRRFSQYLLLTLFFALGLMAKPMLVTLPFILLLLDYWPLNRLKTAGSETNKVPNGRKFGDKRTLLSPFLEKIPLFLLAGAAMIIAFIIIGPSRSGELADHITTGTRIYNAPVSYLIYILKMIRPSGLALPYPAHNLASPLIQAAGAGLLLVCISVFAIRFAGRHSYLIMGWLWYLVTLLPVIGLVQGGPSIMADRYTYIPLIGLFIMLSWGIPDLLSRWRYQKIFLGVAASLLLSALWICSWSQVRHWQNSITLFEHATRITNDNALAHNNLGEALVQEGRLKEAMNHFFRALEIRPDYEEAHNNLGVILARQGKVKEAVEHFHEALRIMPDLAKTYNNLGLASALEKNFDQAMVYYNKALQIQPNYWDANYNSGLVLARLGRFDEAVGHYLEALSIRPDNINSLLNLGRCYHSMGKLDKAIREYKKVILIMPDNDTAYTNLGIAFAEQGKFAGAKEAYKKSLSINPKGLRTYQNLANLYSWKGLLDKAIASRKEALRVDPDYAEAHYHLAVDYYFKGAYYSAIEHCDKAIRLGYKGIEPAFLKHLEAFK